VASRHREAHDRIMKPAPAGAGEGGGVVPRSARGHEQERHLSSGADLRRQALIISTSAAAKPGSPTRRTFAIYRRTLQVMRLWCRVQ
jgi:hypothetical protein